jgi:hypothetical protein
MKEHGTEYESILEGKVRSLEFQLQAEKQKVEQLQAILDKHRTFLEGADEIFKQLKERDQLKQKVERLRRYVGHLPQCNRPSFRIMGPCSCGLDGVLKR